jgi:lipoprotein-releasing system permease protein
MLQLRTIRFITFIANRVKKRSKGPFSATIHKIVTLSITIGFTSILIASMVMRGFQTEIKKKLTSFSGHLTITKYSTQYTYAPPSIQATQIKRLLHTLPNEIEKVEAFAQKPMLIHTKAGIEGIVCKGLDPATAHQTLKMYLITGRLPNLSKEHYQQELCISEHLAQKLSIGLGDTVIVRTIQATARYRKLKIVGIYRTYLNDLDAHLAFCDMRLIQRLNNWTPEIVNGYEIFLKNGIEITKTLRDTILHLIDYDLRLIKTDQKYASFYDWLAIIQKNTTIFMLFILLIAGFTMVATIMIQLMERSYMIGVFKALGAHAWQINAILLCNSFRTLCWGMLYGNILGLGLCFLQGHYKFIQLEPALYYMSYVPIYWSLPSILLLNLLTLGTICLALYATIKLLGQKKVTEALQEGE